MLKPCEMSSIVITGSNILQEKIIKELYKLKILHIVEHSKTDLADIGSPLENANNLSETIVRIRSLMTILGIKKEESKFELQKGLLEIYSTTKNLNEDTSRKFEELKTIGNTLSKNQALMQELEIFGDISIPLDYFTSYRSLACFRGFLKSEGSIHTLREELSKLTKNFTLSSNIIKKKAFIALFVDTKIKENASKILHELGFYPANFGNITGLKGTALSNLKRIGEENLRLESRRDNIKKQIKGLADKYKGFLMVADEFLSLELEKSEAPLKFAVTKNTFLIKGWVPTDLLKNTIDRLNKVSANKLFMHSEPPKITDKVPVKLKNRNYSKPFEFIVDLYSLPSYREIDPTVFISITFPIFFGFMLGDFGYGLVSFALFYLLKKKMPKAASIFNILLLSSLSSIVFGFIFGEFFGFEELGHFQIPHLISRSHGMFELMYAAIGVGVLHVNMGFIIGFFNALKNHGLKHALLGKGGWFVLQIGIALALLSYFGIINLPMLAGIAVLLIAVTMLAVGEGITGIVELPSILTNTLSYMRLMAIGLSSVSIAVVVNNGVESMFHKGGISILWAILIFLIGHVLNLLLGLFGSFLHSLRLHYVEFFSKFFEGGAQKYKPFGIRDNLG